MAAPVTCDRISFSYPDGTPALREISCSIGPGGVTAILGPTGSGKTSLLLGLGGALHRHYPSSSSSGSCFIGPESFQPFPPDVLLPHVALVTQDPWTYISGMRDTVRDEVTFTADNLGIDVSAFLPQVLERLSLSALAERSPLTLSGGELQRVAIASAFVLQPSVLLLDEPTHSLDGLMRKTLAHLLRDAAKQTTVVLADDDIDFALLAADRFLVLDAGSIVLDDNRKGFLQRLSSLDALLPAGSWSANLKQFANKEAPRHLLRWMDAFLEER